jgi:O-methyltransferase
MIRRLLNSTRFLRITEVLDRRSENRMNEFGMLAQAFEFAKINGVKGDYLEFGVWRGKTFRWAHVMKRRYGLRDMKLWAFDSFSGLPEFSETPDNIWNQGQFACSLPEFRRILKSAGVGPDEYETVAGYYSESLNDDAHQRMGGRQAAVVYIDCDLYESTADALRFVAPHLAHGAILCFDDYYNYKAAPDQGEARALAEFRTRYPEIDVMPYFNYSPLGASFIVRHRRGSPHV